METIEKLQYESRPYFYALLSVYSIANYKTSVIMFISGLMLAICSYCVFSMRGRNRRLPASATSKIK